jgi:hypothetical protein
MTVFYAKPYQKICAQNRTRSPCPSFTCLFLVLSSIQRLINSRGKYVAAIMLIKTVRGLKERRPSLGCHPRSGFVAVSHWWQRVRLHYVTSSVCTAPKAMRISESPVRLPMMNTPGATSRFSRALSRSDWPESISESSAGSHSSWRSASLRYFKEPRRPLTYANPLTARSIRLPLACCNVTMAKLPCRRTSTIAVFGNPS